DLPRPPLERPFRRSPGCRGPHPPLSGADPADRRPGGRQCGIGDRIPSHRL
ncbi:MAG: hypothetical protein AVDCRST_MAG90-728, partial [uncultured Microvirga sp.]